MEWFRAHPYASWFFGGAVLILAGIFIVGEKSSSPLSGTQPVAWSGTGTILSPSYLQSAPQTQQPSPDIMQEVENSPPYTYIPPSPTPTTNTESADTNNTDTFDFNSFIATLSRESTPATSSAPQNISLGNAYEFIPGGLISTTTSANARTPLQQSLYDYGNEVGSSIQSFEDENQNQAQVLTDQVQDRANPDKAAAVEALGNSLVSLGNTLLAMDDVPMQMTSAHEALANSYVDIGKKLALVPQAQGDTAFVTAIEAYDTSADAFTKNYVSLVQLFVAYGVKFSPSDAGSVFTFTDTSL